ncbi:MarR family transcriptional regulator, partial [Clostridium perfringens]
MKVPKRNPSIGFHLGYTYRRASHLFANALKPYD